MAKVGRKSKYKPEFAEKLVQHMRQGLSFEAFGGEVGVSTETLYRWIKAKKEFSEAKKIGENLSRLFWERMGMGGMLGTLHTDGPGGTQVPVKNFNATVWIFNMKNRFMWRDAQTWELPPPPGASEEDNELKQLSRAEKIALARKSKA